MSVHATNENGVLRIDIAGDMTIYSAVQIKEELLAAMSGCKEIEINLAHVGEIDAAGLQLLALARREARACGTSLRFVELSHAVREMIELCHLESEFDSQDEQFPA